jgi:3-hydroxyacyl-CoA dehydrogenase/enoyl-CoA hydratase/3-hydroxybutyryl-CoA epimerase
MKSVHRISRSTFRPESDRFVGGLNLVNDNITAILGDDGILVATIDMPGRSMNVFSDDLMDALEAVLDTVSSQTPIIGAVLVSGKSTFLVGADLAMVRRYTESAQRDSTESLHAMCGRLGRLFRRLETCGKPFVAAIDGLALGGGLELALACHQRIASDDRGTQLGLPEIKLGLLPGAGGTQRLPRLAGTAAAFQLLLSGEPVSAQRALELGIVDEVVAKNALMTAARLRVLRLVKATTKAPWDRSGWRPPLNPYDFNALEVTSTIAEAVGINVDRLTHYPAYEAIMESVIGGWLKPMDDACRWEMDCFVQLIRNSVAGNLVRTLFLNRQRAAKLLGRGVPGRRRQLTARGTVTSGLAKTLEQAGVLIARPTPHGDAELVILTDPANSDTQQSDVAWLRGPAPLESFQTDSGVWVSDATEYGRAVEVCSRSASVPANDAVLDLVRWLNAVPLFTREVSLLQSLESIQAALSELPVEDRLLAVALQAARIWCLGGIEDVDLADVATVIAGFAPAYTGGPFTYLRQRGCADVLNIAQRAGQSYGVLFDIPKGCDALWSRHTKVSA